MKNKTIIILQGSIKKNSSNQQLSDWIMQYSKSAIDWQLSTPLDQLPFFNPELDGTSSGTKIPDAIVQFRKQVAKADGILVITPEYVFSLPGVLKNALEWLVSTTLLIDKPTGILVAAASGDKAREQLVLILSTLGVKMTQETALLIKGIKGKTQGGSIHDPQLINQLDHFTDALYSLTEG